MATKRLIFPASKEAASRLGAHFGPPTPAPAPALEPTIPEAPRSGDLAASMTQGVVATRSRALDDRLMAPPAPVDLPGDSSPLTYAKLFNLPTM